MRQILRLQLASTFCKHKVSLLGASTKISLALKGFLLQNGHVCTAHIPNLSIWWANQYIEVDNQPLHLKKELLTPLPGSKAHVWENPGFPLSTMRSWGIPSPSHREIARLRSVLFAKCFETIPWKLYINAKYYYCICFPKLSPRLQGSLLLTCAHQREKSFLPY